MMNDSRTLTDIALCLNRDCNFDQNIKLPPGFFITDASAIADPERIISRLPTGYGVILRDYKLPARATVGQALRDTCRRKGIKFLVAGDADLAVTLKADGLHFPEVMMNKATSVRQYHPDWILTAACHDLSAVRTMTALPLDAGVIAPVFPTDSHPETYSDEKRTLGISGVRKLVSQSEKPLYGLGGITAHNAGTLIGTGLFGLAAIRGYA